MAAWTTDSLTAHLLAELNRRRSTTGSNPDRLEDIVREAGAWLWNSTDWRFRRKTANLTTVADTATVDMPNDFGEMDHRWLRDSTYDFGLRFTEQVQFYQAFANRYTSTDTGVPRVAVIVQDMAETTTFKWHFLLTPTPDAAYVYPYWYLQLDPWTEQINASSSFADSSSPVWPSTFDEGWRLRAKLNAEQSFYPEGKRMAPTMTLWNQWYAAQVAENNETLSRGMERIRDGYGDLDRTPSARIRGAGGYPVR